MDDATAAAVMRRFAQAFFGRDSARLAEAITDDAEWRFAIGDDGPDGRVRVGVAGFLRGIAENDALFERLRFEDVAIRGCGADRIVMTYLAEGRIRGGAEFALRGVELITVRDGRIAVKDVYWKQSRAPG
jgi:ketosteroid isomerase-like protein